MSTNAKVIVGGIIIILIIIGIIYYMSKSTVAPATATNAPAPETTQNQQVQTAAAANASSSIGQVQGQDVAIGTGAEAKPGDTVSVLYVGKLQDGTVFDSSAAHNNQPISFVLGDQKGPIPGFQIGINTMKVGGERILAIPPGLAYGDQAIHQDPADPKTPVIIPANSTLVFDIKLVDVKPGSAATTQAPAQQ